MADIKLMSTPVVEIKAIGINKILMGLKLMRGFKNPDSKAALIAAVTRAGKTGLAAGVAYGIIVTLGLLDADKTSDLLVLIFQLIPVQALIASVSKYAKEKYGITLPV